MLKSRITKEILAIVFGLATGGCGIVGYEVTKTRSGGSMPSDTSQIKPNVSTDLDVLLCLGEPTERYCDKSDAAHVKMVWRYEWNVDSTHSAYIFPFLYVKVDDPDRKTLSLKFVDGKVESICPADNKTTGAADNHSVSKPAATSKNDSGKGDSNAK
jgi:hypothetical protein